MREKVLSLSAGAISVEVNTPSKNYDVLVGRSILASIGERCRGVCKGQRACVISDSNVATLYGEQVVSSLSAAGFSASLLSFKAGEKHKRFSTLERLLEGVAEAGLTRDDVIVAVGGGVTGDMAGLVAALYLRGIQLVQVPTSLLAMVDSSVGGKTAVDLAAGKNLAGAFLQPSLVLADVRCLQTLSPELFKDSTGEVIKHGVIASAELFERIVCRPLTSPGYDLGELAGIIAQNVRIKRDVVSQDEHERGLRQILNFGHTIGHAIEAASEFSLGHGSSVAAGMCCVARGAAAEGICEPEVARAIERACAAHGLPTDTELPHETIMHYAIHDKKRHESGINVVLPLRIGQVEVRHLSLEAFKQLVAAGCGSSAVE